MLYYFYRIFFSCVTICTVCYFNDFYIMFNKKEQNKIIVYLLLCKAFSWPFQPNWREPENLYVINNEISQVKLSFHDFGRYGWFNMSTRVNSCSESCAPLILIFKLNKNSLFRELFSLKIGMHKNETHFKTRTKTKTPQIQKFWNN